MNILVTGGAGFIGSHIVNSCIKEGHQVTVVDNLSSGNSQFLNPEAKFYEMDVLDPGFQKFLKVTKLMQSITMPPKFPFLNRSPTPYSTLASILFGLYNSRYLWHCG